jgi:hypothetical protein
MKQTIIVAIAASLLTAGCSRQHANQGASYDNSWQEAQSTGAEYPSDTAEGPDNELESSPDEPGTAEGIQGGFGPRFIAPPKYIDVLEI